MAPCYHDFFQSCLAFKFLARERWSISFSCILYVYFAYVTFCLCLFLLVSAKAADCDRGILWTFH